MKTKALLGLAILAMVSCSGNKQAKLESLKSKQAKLNEQIKTLEEQLAPADSLNLLKNASYVVAQPIEPSVFHHYIEVLGKLDGDDNVPISARAAGTIESINVNVGQRVVKDQILARIESKMVEKSLSDMEANYKYANDLYEKQKSLWQQNVGSENDYLRAKTNKESMEARLASLREQLDMYTIKSPINGTLEENNIKVGQSVAPGVPVMRVVNFARLKVTADLAESYATRVQEGDHVLVYFPDLKKEVTAVVNFSSRFISPVNRTFSVEARISDISPDLKANMLAVLKINDYKAPNALVLPIDVVQNDQQGNYVFVAKQHSSAYSAKKVRVTTGQSYNDMIEITGGLKPGDKVITTGYQNLEDGQPVRL